MLALFFAWLIAIALLEAITVLPRWVCIIMATIMATIAALALLFKKPQWF